MIYLETDNDKKATVILKEMKEINDVRNSSKGLVVSLKSEGTKFMPKLFDKIRNEGIEIKSINLKKPSLDDVFIQYTGRGLRDENREQNQTMSMTKMMGMSGGGH